VPLLFYIEKLKLKKFLDTQLAFFYEKHFPPKYIYLSRSGFWSILLTSMMLIFNSCVSEEEPFTALVSDSQLAVEDARAWLGPQEEFDPGCSY